MKRLFTSPIWVFGYLGIWVFGVASALGAAIDGTVVFNPITLGSDAAVTGITNKHIGSTAEMKGTPKQVADITARNAIAAARRTEGMDCWVVSEAKMYRLVGGILNANWQEVVATGDGTFNFAALTNKPAPILLVATNDAQSLTNLPRPGVTGLETALAFLTNSVGGSATNAAGTNTQVQFNDSSAFGGDSGLLYNKTTDLLTLAGSLKLPATTSSSVGVLYSGTERYLHSYGSVQNLFLGYDSGNFAVSGDYNTGVGTLSMYALSSGIQNTSLGASALQDTDVGSYNTAVGTEALFLNKSGDANTSIGQRAMSQNISGAYNVAIGVNSLSQNTNGVYNLAAGVAALEQNRSGHHNTAVGSYDALRSLVDGAYNVAVGEHSSFSNEHGYFNTTVGHNSAFLYQGSNSIVLGALCADDLLAGNKNIIIGYNIDFPSTTTINALNIGNLIYGTNVDGSGTTVSSGKVGIRNATPLSTLDVTGDFRASLGVYSYISNGYGFYSQNGSIYLDGNATNYIGGRLGLDTQTPTAQLDVNGAIHVSGNSDFNLGAYASFHKQADFGAVIQGASGSVNDFSLFTPGGNLLLQNPTGTTTLKTAPITTIGDIRASTTVAATNGFTSYRSNLLASALITVTASPFNWTNTAANTGSGTNNIVVYVDGVSVTGTTEINGGVVFNSIGQNTLLLGPAEWITIAYTIGVPTATWRPR